MRRLLAEMGSLSQALYEAADFGIPRSYSTALGALEDRPRRVTELAIRTGLTQPRITVLLQELEERGLVERKRCIEDRRAVETRITPLGRELLEAGRQRMATALLDALRVKVDDPEHVVTLACVALRRLVDAFVPEVS